MHNVHTGFAEVDGAKLYYETAGSGRPLLLLHAGVADCRMWDDQFAQFAQQHRVIRYDLRGFGKSLMPGCEFSGHADAAGLLDWLGIEQTALVGLSFGGATVLDFALAYPKRVRALVLAAPYISGLDQADKALYTPSEELRRYWQAEHNALERNDLEAATEANLRMWVDGPNRTPDQVDAAIRKRVYEMQHHAFTITTPEGARRTPLEPAAFSRLAEIQAPTLVISGEQDVSDFVKISELAAAGIVGAQRIVIPSTAHMSNMEKPAEFNRLVLDFIHQHLTP